jgi:hypothetical protein
MQNVNCKMQILERYSSVVDFALRVLHFAFAIQILRSAA